MDAPKYAYLVRRIHRLSLLRRIWGRRTVEDVELHMQQIPILEFIMQNDGCNQCEIADSLRVSAQSIALSTKRMQHAGLLTKYVDECNLRRNKLSLTEKGRALTEQCRERFENLDAMMCSGLSQEEIDAFCAITDKMISNLTFGDLRELTVDELRDLLCSHKPNPEE